MPYFPQLNANGRMVQRPYTETLSTRTSINDMECGARYAYGWRGAGVSGQPARPLRKASWPYDCISDAELDTLRAFFVSMRGKRGEFTFLSPIGNLVQHSELYSHASWERNSVTVGGATAGPFAGSTATNLTSSGANGNINTVILPDGNAAGIMVCGSAWVKASSAQSLMIGFIDSGFGLIGQATHALPAGEWVRIKHAMRLTGNLPVRLIIGGLNTWTTGQQIAVYGAQVSPTPGMGEYAATPGADGLWPKCRFDMDKLEARKLGRNHAATSAIEIVEVA